jgi:hypothetical protein
VLQRSEQAPPDQQASHCVLNYYYYGCYYYGCSFVLRLDIMNLNSVRIPNRHGIWFLAEFF